MMPATIKPQKDPPYAWQHHEPADQHRKQQHQKQCSKKPKLLTDHRKNHIILRLRHKPQASGCFFLSRVRTALRSRSHTVPASSGTLSHTAPDAARSPPVPAGMPPTQKNAEETGAGKQHPKKRQISWIRDKQQNTRYTENNNGSA